MGAVELRLGRAGSGKSTGIAIEIEKEIRERPIGPKIFWVVPIENSYSAERLLMSRVPSSLRAEVIHLHRLAERALPQVSPFGKAMNITGQRLLLAAVYRGAFSKLQFLRRDRLTVSFLDSILAAFQELTANQVPLAQLEGALESAAARLGNLPLGTVRSGRSLLGKLADLSYLYIRFKRAFEQAGFADPNEFLSRVEPFFETWPDLCGATVYVDGFADLTPQETSFIVALARQVDKTVISLSMDESWTHFVTASSALRDKVGSVDLTFTMSLTDMLRQTGSSAAVYAPQTLALYSRLLAVLRREEFEVSVVTMDESSQLRFQSSPDLACLEQGIYDEPVVRQSKPQPHADNIRFAAARNPRVEAEAVAQEISRLVREGTIRFQDVAVLVPSLDEYAAYLRDSFERSEIPFYMDVFPSFGQHPLARFLLATVYVVRDDFSVESVIRLLKSDFCGLSRQQADRLETYVRRFEVSGERTWLGSQSWRFAERQGISGRVNSAFPVDEEADRLRELLVAYLGPFAHALAPDMLRPYGLSLAIWELIQATNVKRTIATWMVNDDASLSPMEASLHEQAWQRTVELLNDLSSFQGESAELPRAFLLELLEHQIVSQTLTTIPARLGDVLIAEMHRSSSLEWGAVFILGALDGNLPRKMESHGLLQDEERLQFARFFGQRLGYTTEELQLCERLSAYTALTRAKFRLHLSYPLADSKGKGTAPSYFLTRVRELFDPASVQELLWAGMPERDFDAEEVRVFSPQTAMDVLVASLRNLRDGGVVHPLSGLFFKWARGQEKWSKMLEHVVSGWQHQTKSLNLGTELAVQLYREPLTTTVYQLESFAACPFQHFIHFGLRVEPAESPDVTQTARGRLMHDAILGFVQEQQRNWSTWCEMSDEQAEQAMHEVFARTMASPSYWNWQSRPVREEQANELENVLATAAKVLARHARYSSFRPAALELAFGVPAQNDAETALPPLAWKTRSGREVLLRGRIDRVDLARDDVDENSSAFRIFDYKSSKRDLDFSQIDYGLSLQLPIYAAAVEKFSASLFGNAARPAGMFYLPIAQAWKTHFTPVAEDEATMAQVKAMRARGVLVNDDRLLEWMDWRVAKGEDSDLFGKVYNKDQQVTKTAPVVTQETFQAMTRRALAHVEEFGDQILMGETAIAPAQVQGKQAACAYCPYGVICHLDLRVDGKKFRKLAKRDKDQVIANWMLEFAAQNRSHALVEGEEGSEA